MPVARWSAGASVDRGIAVRSNQIAWVSALILDRERNRETAVESDRRPEAVDDARGRR